MKHSDFKEKARLHQIAFKNDKEIDVPANHFYVITRKGKDYPVESSLLKDDCMDADHSYRIFFSGFRQEISTAVKEKMRDPDNAPSGQMVTNLLRSEHIPYNIFFPMRHDLEGTAAVFNALLGENRIACIGELIIEYKPKRTPEDGTSIIGDGTAFDVYIPYISVSGNKGGLGIEVKYTEKEYPLKKFDKDGKITKEYRETHDENGIHLADNYRLPSEASGWFINNAIRDIPFSDIKRDTKHIVMNHYRQIWRNHLLGAAMTLQPEGDENHLDEFISITIYPKDNGHFSKDLWDAYEGMLTENGKPSLRHITYEELFPLMRTHLRGIEKIDEWIDYLYRRYIISES